MTSIFEGQLPQNKAKKTPIKTRGPIWVLGIYMDVSKNSGFSPPNHPIKNRAFHYKSSHFGVPLFLETPM